MLGDQRGEEGGKKRNPEISGRVPGVSGCFPESGQAPQADRMYFSGKPRENYGSFILHYPDWFVAIPLMTP
jgi:hypothetical protein